ncbi:hypothetical protein Y032_0721g1823 [Ancylostoma ceylanicum]|uniref:Uncharacterized protein n=1 Tax=Ancylostoma ceylanicum TaxID=53326 RepID=A0A016WH75_9BILA|nr:hypothetical protein Y032_0721g1823 [Ancylostoma ceylanicum]
MRTILYLLAVLATISSVFGMRGALFRAGRAAPPNYGRQDFLRFGRNAYGSAGQDLFASPWGEYYAST